MNRLARVVIGALALLAAACNDATVAPQTDSQEQFSAQGADLSSLAKYRDGPPQIVIGFAMKAIGPAGGTISLAGFQAIVPPGAVSKWTNFTIRLPVDPTSSSYVWASFGPHGATFAAPVTIRLPYNGTTSEGDAATHVMWYDGSTWVELASAFTDDGRIETQTKHFSDYGTEANPTRGITLSGKPAAR